jgi:hypothetical protein
MSPNELRLTVEEPQVVFASRRCPLRRGPVSQAANEEITFVNRLGPRATRAVRTTPTAFPQGILTLDSR